MQQRSLDLFFSPRGAGASKAAKAARRDEQGGASPSRQEGEKTLKRLKKTSAADDEPEPEPEPRRQSVIGISLAGDGSAAQTPPKKKGLSLKPPGKGDNPGGSTAAKGGVSLAGVGQKSIAAAGDQKAFNSKDGAKWSASAPVPYSVVTETFDKVASDRARLTKIKFLTELYRTVIATTPEDLLPIVYLSTNALAPAHEGIELGIGDATIIKALSECTGRTEKKIKDDLKREGDLGVVALSSRSTQSTLVQPKPLLVRQVFQDFKAIAMTSGQSSVERKKKIIKRLLTSSKKTEATYVVRALQGKLRIGSSELTVLPALSKAIMWEKGEVDASSKEAIAESEERGHIILKQAYFEYPNLEVIVPALLEHGVLGIAEHCKFTVGVPVKPMLAKPTTGVQEVLDKFTDVEFTCEYKYDGERAQIHYEEGKGIKIFSRNSENNAPKYPELVSEIIPASLKPTTKSLVLDGEVVAYDKVKKEILRFQLLQKRKRKDVSDEDMKNQAAVCYFAFDCLHYNGQSLLRSSLVERRKALREACEEREGNFFFATDKTSSDVEELQAFLDESIVAKTEGLIIKVNQSLSLPLSLSLSLSLFLPPSLSPSLSLSQAFFLNLHRPTD